MKRKWLLAMVLLSGVLALVSGCGLSTANYEAVVTERDAAKTQLESANAELASTKAQLESANAELVNTKTQLELTKTQLQQANSQLESTESSLSDTTYKLDLLQQKVARAKVLVDLAELYTPYTQGLVIAPSESTTIGARFISEVTNSGDAELLRLFQEWIVSGLAKQPTADLFSYVFETLPRLLQ